VAAAAAQQADGIAGMLGPGAVTADAELDDLVEQIEAQVCGLIAVQHGSIVGLGCALVTIFTPQVALVSNVGSGDLKCHNDCAG
jgi:hypothetical protein